MKKQGFTLAEILLILAIIGVVAALAIANLVQNLGGAKVGPKLAKFVSQFELAAESAKNREEVKKLSNMDFPGELERYIGMAKISQTFEPVAPDGSTITGAAAENTLKVAPGSGVTVNNNTDLGSMPNISQQAVQKGPCDGLSGNILKSCKYYTMQYPSKDFPCTSLSGEAQEKCATKYIDELDGEIREITDGTKGIDSLTETPEGYDDKIKHGNNTDNNSGNNSDNDSTDNNNGVNNSDKDITDNNVNNNGDDDNSTTTPEQEPNPQPTVGSSTWQLKDGTLFKLVPGDSTEMGYATSATYLGYFKTILVDIGGLDGKHRAGIEVFRFIVDNSGLLIPYGSSIHRKLMPGVNIPECNRSGSSIQAGYACTGAFSDNAYKTPQNYK